MIVSPEQWQDVWDQIEDEFADSSEKGLAVIFSQAEVETVCAVKMLQLGLRKRDVPFSTYPVAGYGELESTLSSLLNGSEDFRTIMLINCGAGAYVKALAPSDALNVRYIVVDSHRPVDPRYNDPDDIDCLLLLSPDDPLPLMEVPPSAPGLDDITDEERAQLAEFAAQELQQEEEDHFDRDSGDSEAKRARTDAAGRRHFRDKLRLLQQRDAALAAYWDMGCSYGKPTPLVLQPLAELLCGRLDNGLLWPCCVGLTDQWVHQRVSDEHYALWHAALRDQVRVQDANAAAAAAGAADAIDGGAVNGRAVQVIVAARDYRLMLHRHWTLHDALVFSSYVAPRLQTWRQAGRDSVALLLARMGIPLEQARTRFDCMQSGARRAFAAKFADAVAGTRLAWSELAAEGFCLQHSRKATAASDVVHAATALLSEPGLHGACGDSEGHGAAAFWSALAAIDAHTTAGWRALERGVEAAKLMQQAIIQDGGLLVTDRRLVVNTASHMQELLLHTDAPTNAAEFRHPLTLLRLAHFVRDATKLARRAAGLKAVSYPILAVGPEDAQGYCLAVGLRAGRLPDAPQYNVFGRTFAAVLADPESATRWDEAARPFDAAVLRLHKDSVANFCMDVRAALRDEAVRAEEARAADTARRRREAAAAAVGTGGGAAAAAAAGDTDVVAAAGAGATGGELEGEESAGGESLAVTNDSEPADSLAALDVVAASEDGGGDDDDGDDDDDDDDDGTAPRDQLAAA